ALLLAGSLLVFGLVVEEIVEGGVVRHRHSGVMSVRHSRRRGGNGNLANYIAFVTNLRTPRCRCLSFGETTQQYLRPFSWYRRDWLGRHFCCSTSICRSCRFPGRSCPPWPV